MNQTQFRRLLDRVYFRFTLGLFVFIGVLGGCEYLGMPKPWIGMAFLLATMVLYAAIGVMSRTTDPVEYYVAGRRVPALYNGMAIGADWMSAASFIGLAGTLYMSGYNGLSFVIGWTGGYCLVALLLAPYLRKFGQFTLPDFLAERYGGQAMRLLSVAAAILCSFVYLVAQIYGVGLITSLLTGLAFEVGVFLGLGGILLCSFLGGMRAVTWTQVAQYIVLIVAYMLPVAWLSAKQSGFPLPPVVYGSQLVQIGEREQQLLQDPAELEVQALARHRVQELQAQLAQPEATLSAQRQAAQAHLDRLRASNASLVQVASAELALARLPRDAQSARVVWSQELEEAQAQSLPLRGMLPHAQPFAGEPDGSPAEQSAYRISQLNFLALVFCLTVGTAALPHILMRYYTVPSVAQARQSVAWAIFFISLLYLLAPALAVLVKYEILNHLVGSSYTALPEWVQAWAHGGSGLLTLKDINADGRVQLNEISLGSDIVALAAADMAGAPYVIAALLAAGGLAAALSTADGLLLTIANALSHDLYYKLIDPNASTARRVTISKVLLLLVALLAAYLAAQKPADILFLVSAAFSFAAAAFFPVLVLGIFWKRTTRLGAIWGMLTGLGVTLFYMISTQPWLRSVFGVTQPVQLWWDILPISAGFFGVPVGFAVVILVSLLDKPPPESTQRWVDELRQPPAASPLDE